MQWTLAQENAFREEVRLIEAGAGAGKTAVLVEVYLRRLRSRQVGGDPRRILALTFSEKAAAEMKSRIQEAVGQAWPLRFDLEEAPISTIHAFAGNLINRYYYRLGFASPPKVIEGSSAAFMQFQSIDMAMSQLKSEKSSILLGYLIDTPESTLRHDLGLLFKKPESVRRWLSAYHQQSDASVWLTESAEGEDARHTQLAYDKLKALGDIFEKCWALYQQLKYEEGRVDFDDLLRLGVALAKDQEVGQELREQYPVVLVDEFQDTGTLEWELIKTISGADDRLLSERLLLVGDVKQSIYGFKGAAPARMAAMTAAFSDSMPTALRMLPDNFRSTSLILAFVNGFFGRAFQSSYGDFDLTYHPAISRRPDSEGGVGMAFCPAAHEGVKNQVLRLVEQGYAFRDIAILVRQKSSIEPIRKTLVRQGIPIWIHGGQGFFQRQEVIDVILLIQILCRNDDQVAWAGILQSPWVGLSDESITALVGSGDVWEAIQNGLGIPPDQQARVSRWALRFGRWQTQYRSCPLSAVLLDALKEMGWFTFLEHAEDGQQKVANVHKLIQLVANLEVDAQAGILDLEQALTHHALQRILEPDEAASDDLNAVKIMTVHAAKGLEFRAVILPGLEMPFHFGKAERIYISEAHGVAMSLGPAVPGENRLRAQIREKVIGQGLDEEIRLFYVGCTRAREVLILVAEADEFPSFSREQPQSVLDLLARQVKAFNKGKGITFEFGFVPDWS